MERSEDVILTNMCMVYDGNKVLVQEKILRGDRKKNRSKGIIFPGGHVEPGESFTESVIREVREETGLTIKAPRLCGLKQFPLDGGGRYIVFLYRADRFSGELVSSEEGRVFWMKRSELEKAELPVSFAQTLRVFEEYDLEEHYIHWEDGVLKRELL